MRHEARVETWTRVKAEPFAAHRGPYSADELEQFTGPRDYYITVATLAEAQGILFLCPLCFAKNGGSVGTHGVRVGFTDRAPPATFSQNTAGADTRWNIASGSGLDDLSLTPSIALDGEGGCKWHGFVGSNGVPPGSAA